jgi:hypothetical protein
MRTIHNALVCVNATMRAVLPRAERRNMGLIGGWRTGLAEVFRSGDAYSFQSYG